LLKKSGKIERLDRPYTGLTSRPVAAVVFARPGMFVVSHAIGNNGAIGQAGIFQVSDNKLSPVLRAYVVQIVVSPDGCRIATTASELRPDVPKLKLIDLCAGGS
jgi:hypothetical protein